MQLSVSLAMLCLAACFTEAAVGRHDLKGANAPLQQLDAAEGLPVDLPNVTSSGYLQLSDSKTEDLLFYAFYEAQELDAMDSRDVPIMLWLEVGPSLISREHNMSCRVLHAEGLTR